MTKLQEARLKWVNVSNDDFPTNNTNEITGDAGVSLCDAISEEISNINDEIENIINNVENENDNFIKSITSSDIPISQSDGDKFIHRKSGIEYTYYNGVPVQLK